MASENRKRRAMDAFVDRGLLTEKARVQEMKYTD